MYNYTSTCATVYRPKMHTQCPMLYRVCMLCANQCANDQDNKDDNHRYQIVLTNSNNNKRVLCFFI